MNKTELIAALADRHGHLTIEDVETSVNLILTAIAKGLSSGVRTEIRGFGSFDVARRKARIGRNPKTGELVDIQAKAFTRFKASKQLVRVGPHYKLADLLAQCDPKALKPQDIKDWESLQAIGMEKWPA